MLLSYDDLPINDSKLILCAYCKKLKGRSKRFVSFHALTWHVTHHHKDDMGTVDIIGVLS